MGAGLRSAAVTRERKYKLSWEEGCWGFAMQGKARQAVCGDQPRELQRSTTSWPSLAASLDSDGYSYQPLLTVRRDNTYTYILL